MGAIDQRRPAGGPRAEAGEPGPYLLALVLAWAVPGLGHWILGYRARAVVLGALLLVMFWWGEAAAGGYAVIRAEHPYFFYAQIGMGASALIADRVEWAPDVQRAPPPGAQGRLDRTIPPLLTTGILLTSVSGLLNMLLVLHILDPRTREGRRREEGRGPRPA
jgi:hypothetical protein